MLYKNVNLELLSENEIIITVDSTRAKDALSRDNELLEKLRIAFRKNNLSIKVEIEEKEADDIIIPKVKPNNDREKYSYFMQMNPLLADFQKRFELYPANYNPKKK